MRLNHVLEDQAGDAGSAAGGNAAGNAGAGAAGAGGAGNADAGAGKDQGGAGAGSGDAGGEASLLAQAGKGAAAGDGKGGDAAGAGNQGGEKLILGKFKDQPALETAYTSLEKRMRDGGAPPEKATDYKFETPAELKGIELDGKASEEFKTFCHGLGLTQKQYQAIMGRYLQEIPALADGATSYSADKLKAELLTGWKGNEELLHQNLKAAVNVVKAFGDEQDVKEAMSAKGNTPPWVYRILAKVGAEMGEDKLLSSDAIVAPEDLQALLNHPAYVQALATGDTTHPEYARIKAKVDAHYKGLEAQNRMRKVA